MKTKKPKPPKRKKSGATLVLISIKDLHKKKVLDRALDALLKNK